MHAEETQEAAAKFSWNSFGLSEGFTKQSSFSGVNLSTLPYWNPKFRLTSRYLLEGILGGTFMKSNRGTFFATRVQAGASVHDLFSTYFNGKDRWVPEVLLGIENWAVSEGGTFAVLNANVHYRFLFENRWLGMLDSLYMGYQQMFNAPHSAKQYVIGLRVTPFWREKVAVRTEALVPPPPPTKSESVLKENLLSKMSRVSFEPGGSKLKASSSAAIKDMAALLQSEGVQTRIRIVGYTDNVGQAKFNQDLSEKRAASVMQALIAQGVGNDRLEALGRGQENPVGDNATSAGRAANRRVDIEVLNNETQGGI